MELIFVYNADNGSVDKMIGALHKVVHPSSYACELCQLTHHAVGARKAWKSFVDSSSLPVTVLYRNEFQNRFSDIEEFPAIFSYENSRLTRILDKKELGAINDLQELFVLLKRRLPTNVNV